jgi:hypothetical protein
MKQTRWAVFGLLSVLLVTAVLACSLAGLLTGAKAPQLPGRTVAVNQQAAQEARDAFQQISSGGRIRLSESQFTSYLREQLTQGQSENVVITDLTVWFDPGRITLRANLQGPQTAQPSTSGEIVVAGNLQVQNGVLKIKIDQASLAGIAVPNALLNLFNDQLNNSMADVNQSGHSLKNVVIEQGYITLEVSE